MAIVSALFVAMVCFLLSTALIAKVREDLALTRLSARNAQKYFAARGAAAEVLATLKQGGRGPEDYPQDEPWTLEFPESELLARCWVVEDDTHPGVYHIHAVVEPQHFTLTIATSGEPGPVVFAGVTLDNPIGFGVVSLRVNDGKGEDWEELPSPPTTVYDTTGALVDATGRHLTNHYTADDQGHLFVERCLPGVGTALYRYDHSSGQWDTLPSVPQVEPIGDGGGRLSDQSEFQSLGGEWSVSRDGRFLSAPVHLNPGQNGGKGGPKTDGYYVRTLDIETGEWTLRQKTEWIDEMAMGTSETWTVRGGPHEQSILRGEQSIPPFSKGGTTYRNYDELTAGPNGEIYVIAGDGSSDKTIAKYQDGSWSEVVLPPGVAPIDNEYYFDQMSVDSEGNLLITDAMYDGTVHKLTEDGTWEPVEALGDLAPEEHSWSHVGGGTQSDGGGTFAPTASL